MTPTRRGLVVCGIVLVGFLMAAVSGARSLNAVVVPALIALIGAVLQVRSRSVTAITRELPAATVRGETITVRFHADTDEPFPGTIQDSITNGHDETVTIDTVVGSATSETDITFPDRGEARFGPIEVVAQDVLGLVDRRFVMDTTDSMLVYPRTQPLEREFRQKLIGLRATEQYDERESFDYLREYERGDTLRDVNWKASAKRDDLIVIEYGTERASDPVTISAGGPDADGFAEATASLALPLLKAEIPIRVHTPEATVAVERWERRHRLLAHLARVGPGAIPNNDTDIVVSAPRGTTDISVGNVVWKYENIVSDVEAGGPSALTGTRSHPRDGTKQEVQVGS